VRRRIFFLASVLSLLLCAATVLLWVRSHAVTDALNVDYPGHRMFIVISHGDMLFELSHIQYNPLASQARDTPANRALRCFLRLLGRGVSRARRTWLLLHKFTNWEGDDVAELVRPRLISNLAGVVDSPPTQTQADSGSLQKLWL
jgi:hypothetical protein